MNERPEPCFDVEAADEPARQHDAATALPRVVASEVLLDSELPTLALIAVGYLIPNVDRIGSLFARAREG